ncbi:MAG: hypothetical protein WC846_04320 [Candidatus Gracilibacteria bacterium]
MHKIKIPSLILIAVLLITGISTTSNAVNIDLNNFTETGGEITDKPKVIEDSESTSMIKAIDDGDYDEGTHKCTGANQEHTHINNSENTPTTEYWGVVHSFAIVLDTHYNSEGLPEKNDFWENVNTSTLLCTNGGINDGDADGTNNNKYINCGFDKDTITPGTVIASVSAGKSEWSGVTITYDTLDWLAGNPRALIWEYGTSDPDNIDLKPWLASGENKIEGISFELEDYDEDHTVTTQSWTEMEFFSINKDADYTDLDNWKHTYTDQVDPYKDVLDPDGDYVYWYGLNGTARSYFPVCPPTNQSPTCTFLSITPNTLNVSDVFTDTDFTVKATGQNTSGAIFDMTDDLAYTYYANKYGSNIKEGDASGYLSDGPWGVGSNIMSTTSNNITFGDTLPGDSLYVFATSKDYKTSYEADCNAYVEFPYCTDLNITKPIFSGLGLNQIRGNNYSTDVNIEAEASTGEPWPYTYVYESTDSSATFDDGTGTANPLTTDKESAAYKSNQSATVAVGLNDYNEDGVSDDVANACSANFDYMITPPLLAPTCKSLTVDPPASGVISIAEMSAGNVEISWTSVMTDGSPDTGPWDISSTNTSGEFRLIPRGPIISTSGIANGVTAQTVYYTGTQGDTIYIEDALANPMDDHGDRCNATITSETDNPVAPVCEDLNMGDPYVYNLDGTRAPIDITDPADLAILYAHTTVCWDYELSASGTYSDIIFANGYTDTTASATHNGILRITSNETGGTSTGINPAHLTIGGYSAYTGTICMQNFDQGAYLTVTTLDGGDACSAEASLPPQIPVEMACSSLTMTPDTVTMKQVTANSGKVDAEITVAGSSPLWKSLLMVKRTGTGSLSYGGGSPLPFLIIPVSGTSTTLSVEYTGAAAGDTISSFIVSDPATCGDELTISELPALAFCSGLAMDPASLTIPLGLDTAKPTDIKTVVTGSDQTWKSKVIMNSTGSGQLRYADGTRSTFADGHLEFDVSGLSTEIKATLIGAKDGDIITCEDIGDPGACSDSLGVASVEKIEVETPVCNEVTFEGDSNMEISGCQDYETEICVDTERVSEDIIIERSDSDNVIEINNLENGECKNITLENICEDTTVTASTKGADETCEDTISFEEKPVGEFNKYIYTFNFLEEKSYNSDDDVFFSHDEDRAFYTLEYTPAGGEEEITFTDTLWDGSIDGTLGDGGDSGGELYLAETYDSIIEHDKYNYSAIKAFGLGSAYEDNSNSLRDEVLTTYTASNFQSFVPYLKYNDDKESELIPSCEDEPDSVCYNPDETPTLTGSVTIENAGQAEEEGAIIRIRYIGIIDSGISGDCDGNTNNDGCLTEEFMNEGAVNVGSEELTDSARLVVICSYLLTENAGDIYLDAQLNTGSDISCAYIDEDTNYSSYSNSDGLIIIDQNASSHSTGSSSSSGGTSGTSGTSPSLVSPSYSSSSVSFCDNSYSTQNIIGNISSYVCEIVNAVSDLWTNSTVTNTTENSLSQATRNAVTNQGSQDDFNTWGALENALTNTNNPDSGILYFKGSGEGDKVTISSSAPLTVPCGAWTLIVENADLYINGNIEYATACTGGLNYETNLPSIAFVVTGGDIYIEAGASHLVGVYYTNQAFTGDDRSAVNQSLEIDGSLYGDIQPLLDAANYVGPPSIDGGGLVVRYDSRIMLNTPPALSEYVDISTESAVN